MDIATLIGLVAGIGLVGYGIMSAGSLSLYVDYSSMYIVFGGTLATLLISNSSGYLLDVGKVFRKVFVAKTRPPQEVIADLVSYAEIARRDGILSLDAVAKQLDDPFVVRGLQMAVDGTDPELIKHVLTTELEALAERHASGKGILDGIAKSGPAFGMIGTLIGLVAMLANLNDPSKIGPGMAVAILTTLYGAIMANLFCIPMADKLAVRSSEEMLNKSIVLMGIMSIQSGDNPRIVEQKLNSFLAASSRVHGQKAKAA